MWEVNEVVIGFMWLKNEELVCSFKLTSSIHPLNYASQMYGQPLNFLNGIKIQSIIKQIVFVAFLR
jgi:hypothetical protein